jgi:hypothetical protein
LEFRDMINGRKEKEKSKRRMNDMIEVWILER